MKTKEVKIFQEVTAESLKSLFQEVITDNVQTAHFFISGIRRCLSVRQDCGEMKRPHMICIKATIKGTKGTGRSRKLKTNFQISVEVKKHHNILNLY